MAHIVVIDEGTKHQRYKVMYEVRAISGARKRKSKTFPENANMKEIKAFVRTVEKQYEDDDVGLNYERISFRQFFAAVIHSCRLISSSGFFSLIRQISLQSISNTFCTCPISSSYAALVGRICI